MADLERLREHLSGLGRVLLGYSGGVDSALLAVVGAQTLGPERFLAIIGLSPSFAAAQRRAALDLADRFQVPVMEMTTHELDDAQYAANSTDRCYFCKRELWSRLRPIAQARGFDVIVDGTNADDLGEHRPGLRAAEQQGIRSPLAELGWSKAKVRAAARGLGLPVWDAPASPCLASRIRYGLAVTADRLGQVERGETFLRALGVLGNLRVRHLGDHARIEVEPQAFALLDARWPEIEGAFAGLGFARVERDPRGYRRGALLALAAG